VGCATFPLPPRRAGPRRHRPRAGAAQRGRRKQVLAPRCRL